MTIDWWTLGLETVNVAVLIWLLGRFFWRPAVAMIEARRKAAAKIMSEAEATRQAADKALADAEDARGALGRDREALLATARKEAEKLRGELIAKAKDEARSLHQAEQAALEAGRVEADKAWADRSAKLAADMAGRLAARLDGPQVRAVFLDWLVTAIAKLPAEAREAALADGARFDVVSAIALPRSEQSQCRKRVAEALAGKAEIGFKTDPALISGLELRSPHLTIRNSWRADLDAMLAEVSRDG